jgi:hypothetical protein
VRQRGEGARARQIDQTFALFKKRYGLDIRHSAPKTQQPARHPHPRGQLPLFEG